MNEPRFKMIAFDCPDADGHCFKAMRLGTAAPEQMLLARNWCRAEFGDMRDYEVADNYRGSRWAGFSAIWFRDEQDALAFKMRWC